MKNEVSQKVNGNRLGHAPHVPLDVAELAAQPQHRSRGLENNL